MRSRLVVVVTVACACASTACVGDDTTPAETATAGTQGGSGPPSSSYDDASGPDANWVGEDAGIDATLDGSADAPVDADSGGG